jgi:hypothetical protein
VDPERQWIASLEPETPFDREQALENTPRKRAARLVIHAAIGAAGWLGLLDFFGAFD